MYKCRGSSVQECMFSSGHTSRIAFWLNKYISKLYITYILLIVFLLGLQTLICPTLRRFWTFTDSMSLHALCLKIHIGTKEWAPRLTAWRKCHQPPRRVSLRVREWRQCPLTKWWYLMTWVDTHYLQNWHRSLMLKSPTKTLEWELTVTSKQSHSDLVTCQRLVDM